MESRMKQDTTSPAYRWAMEQEKKKQREHDEFVNLALCGRRYIFLRAMALDWRRGLEAFVAIEQLDHIGDTAIFDAAIDAAMLKTG